MRSSAASGRVWASEPVASVSPALARYKNMFVPPPRGGGFPTAFCIPFLSPSFPSLSCTDLVLSQASARALLRADKYGAASEKNDSARPPALIRSISQQHFLVTSDCTSTHGNDADGV